MAMLVELGDVWRIGRIVHWLLLGVLHKRVVQRWPLNP
jgi:hypothetical protein